MFFYLKFHHHKLLFTIFSCIVFFSFKWVVNKREFKEFVHLQSFICKFMHRQSSDVSFSTLYWTMSLTSHLCLPLRKDWASAFFVIETERTLISLKIVFGTKCNLNKVGSLIWGFSTHKIFHFKISIVKKWSVSCMCEYLRLYTSYLIIFLTIFDHSISNITA